MSGTLAALRQAATVLLAEAPLPLVRATLRALLADAEAPLTRPAELADKRLQTHKLNRPQRKAPPGRRPTDDTWDARRREIRTAMLERGVSYQDLAEQFGVAAKPLRHTLGRRAPPTKAMRQRFDTWLATEPAPVVAAAPLPFRANGAGGRHGDGAERAAAD
jgi:hypothetical protein